VNIRYEILDWFKPSCRVIAIRPVLMYYAIEIDFSLILSGSFRDFPGMSFAVFRRFPGDFWDVLQDFSGIFSGLSSMWIYPLYL
jgi:hypothetical protein